MNKDWKNWEETLRFIFPKEVYNIKSGSIGRNVITGDFRLKKLFNDMIFVISFLNKS